MNKLQIFNFKQNDVRTVSKDGEPWFVAKDVCDILDISKHRDAVSRLDEDERGSLLVDTLGGRQAVSAVNEYGLYSLILKSRKPEAKEFKRWITHDVIPAIRKTGSYGLPQQVYETYKLPHNYKEALLMLAETVDENDQLKEKIESDKEKVTLANAITVSDEGLLIEAVAKYMRQNGINIGRDRLFKWLRGNCYLVSRKGREWNMPTQKSLNQGLMKINCTLFYDSDGQLRTNRQVVVTGKGLMYFINKFLHQGQLSLPLGGD